MVATNHTNQWSNGVQRGAQLLNQGHHKEALKELLKALNHNPEDALICYNIGLAYYWLKDYVQAETYYRKAIITHPDFVEAYHNLAQTYSAQHKIPQAIDSYQKALELNAQDYQSAFNLGLIYRKLGDSRRAIAAIKSAIRSNPNLDEAICTLGMIFCEQYRFEEALVCLDQALCINPSMAQALYYKGVVAQKTGQYEISLQHYQKATTCDPAFAPAQWLYHLSLPMVYDHPEQIEPYRHRFEANLDRLILSIDLSEEAHKTFALKGIQTTTNFYLQYQGFDDLALQKKYGCFVHKVVKACYPQWTIEKKMPPLGSNPKIRIGYVTTFMHDHTVGTFLSGWLESHSKTEFDIHCYHVGMRVDETTHHLRHLSHHFHYFAGNLETAAGQIHKDNLHILIYPDIGMDPMTTLLGALRLAPVQCVCWGHPVTTGLPTMDYFLSSDLMEPENADAFYSETLVRLPNIDLYYYPPTPPEKPKSRHEFGIPEDRLLFLSSQSIFKYLPQHDDIYPRIAKEAPHSFFVFICNQSKNATERFQSRLRNAFASFGLNSDQFCQFVTKLKHDEFLSLNLSADVLLDSLEWSGGKTTLEAISCGLPVVTLPGRFMRGRHAYAMLRMMGMAETIALNKSNYCDIAIRLAQDPIFLSEIKDQMAANRHRLYHDKTFMTELEKFFHSIVDQHIDQGPDA